MSTHPDPSRIDRLDALEGPDRAALLAHLCDCADCRLRLVERDPSALFALLALRPVPQAVLEQVSSRVAASIDPRPARGRRGTAVAAWAAALLLAALGAWAVLSRPGPPPRSAAIDLAVAPAVPHAGVELLSSPGAARVVDLTVGDTQVVMIFDSRLEL